MDGIVESNECIQILVPLSISMHFMFQKEKIDIIFARLLNEFLNLIYLVLLYVIVFVYFMSRLNITFVQNVCTLKLNGILII